MDMHLNPPGTIFLSYAQKDEELKQEFEDYLAVLQENGQITGWTERQVQRGTDWSQIVDPHILDARLILLFLSPAFVASGYFSGAEMREALARRDAGQAHLIPIILHPVNLRGSRLEILQPLPRTRKPVSSWLDRREAWEQIDQEISWLIQRDRQQKTT